MWCGWLHSFSELWTPISGWKAAYVHICSVGIQHWIANPNKIKGFGLAILMLLFLAVIYDGMFLVSLVMFDDYSIDKFSLIASMLNPIDLSRILIILALDISVLLGYNGEVFRKFFDTSFGMIVSFGLLFTWAAVPVALIVRQAKKKDF